MRLSIRLHFFPCSSPQLQALLFGSSAVLSFKIHLFPYSNNQIVCLPEFTKQLGILDYQNNVLKKRKLTKPLAAPASTFKKKERRSDECHSFAF